MLKNLTSDQSDKSSTTIVAKDGIIQERKKLILFDGQIISTQKENLKNNIIKFEQININLENLSTDTITMPKLQETPTFDLLQCIFFKSYQEKILNCKKSAEKEIKTVLNRRFVLPFYIPIISLLCSFLIVRVEEKKKIIFKQIYYFYFKFFNLIIF